MSIYRLTDSVNGHDNSFESQPADTASPFKFLLDELTQTAGDPISSSTQADAQHSTQQTVVHNTFLSQLWQSDPAQAIENAENVDRAAPDFSTPLTFIKSIAAPAREAAAKLGTSVQAVIAIAALETGWGKHIIQISDGQSSNNLYGIKSTGGNQKSTVFANTTEYIDGNKLTLEEPFRTYATPADSVNDFANFIRTNPRYEEALRHADDAQIFIEQIHQAGYATDPEYAAKVTSVMTQVEKMMNSPDYHLKH